MFGLLFSVFGQIWGQLRGLAIRMTSVLSNSSNRLVDIPTESAEENPVCEATTHLLEDPEKEEAVDPSCINNCGRAPAKGFDTCCRTCIATNGASHGPVCEANVSADDKTTAAPTPACKDTAVWWVDLGTWVRIDNETQELIRAAKREGRSEVHFQARGHPYIIDLNSMTQINLNTLMQRDVKETEEDEPPEEEPDDEEEESESETPAWLRPRSSKPELAPPPARDARLAALVDLLLSSNVQVPLPAEAKEEPEKLKQEEVKKVFKEHVPGVEKFLFREMHGQYSLNFLASAYQNGLRAFNGTPMDNHLKWLMRSIVHYGHEKKPGASRYLKEARVVERVGLELLGVSQDFRGLVRAMVGDYKVMAIKMLAIDHLSRGVVSDDGNPTHYENRLTADLGSILGLNKDDIRRADLDEHAGNRFPRLRGDNAKQAAQRCKELFDVEALARTLCNEVNSFSESTSKDSLPGQFMKWADETMTQKHLIFDEDTCTKVEVEMPLAIALLEVLFSGKPGSELDEEYRGVQIKELFHLEKCEVSHAEIPKEEEKKPPEPGLDTVLFGVWQFSAFWNFDGFRSRMATLASEKGRNEHGNDGLLVSQAAKPKPAKGRSPPGKKLKTKR
ncbi:unnamed protein product [Durusdinium trenchii]|uniref:WWE domain-containing protein n=1 Tax=Durusdinium trenchii TaxID=1381693 RepID=A0ABP0H5X7_9DINO